MHWKHIQNPEFRNLAMWSAYDDDPSMEYAEDDHDGTITVVFGSSPANVTLRLIDWEVISLFTHGHCAALALVLHEKTGLPFIVFTSDTAAAGDWSGHVGLFTDDGQVLDITGVRTIESVNTDFRITAEPTVMTLAEAVNTIVDPDYRDNPLTYLNDLERFVLNDFADFVIETYLP